MERKSRSMKDLCYHCCLPQELEELKQQIKSLREEILDKQEELDVTTKKLNQISDDRWKRCIEIDMLRQEIKKLKGYQNRDTEITNMIFSDLQLSEHEELINLRIKNKILEAKLKDLDLKQIKVLLELQYENEAIKNTIKQLTKLYLNSIYGKKEEK